MLRSTSSCPSLLRDGFHRVHEARARGYAKQVWAVVLDMDEERTK